LGSKGGNVRLMRAASCPVSMSETGDIPGILYPAADHLFQDDWTKLQQGSDYRPPFQTLNILARNLLFPMKSVLVLEAYNGSTQAKGLARTLYCCSA